MLPTDIKQCDLCKRDFSKNTLFINMTITWDHSDNATGRYITKQLCNDCYKILNDKINQALGSKSIWHKINPAISGTAQGLKDHYYYLITHADYKTPLKAKYHVEDFWDIIGTIDPNHPFVYGSERVWLSEENCPIIAWAELPDIYEENI